MIDKSVAFIVRRARLLLGMTRMQFAELYGVDEATVYQWELGLHRPSAEIWERLCNITLQAYPFLDEELVRASPVNKCIADMKDLAHPVVGSRAIMEALRAVGAPEAEENPFDFAANLDRQSPDYEVSALRAFEIIQADPGWLPGEIVYAQSHCVVTASGGWADVMVTPLPDHLVALIEGAPSRRGAAEGFQVRLVRREDMVLQGGRERDCQGLTARPPAGRGWRSR
jgi:transcriptional regulator with XRE-family HTH domain